MNVLNNLTIKNLINNKKRSIGTIIGIILSVALICAVCLMFFSLKLSLQNNAIKYNGYYHIVLYDLNKKDVKVLENNKDIKEITKMYEVGYVPIEGDDRIFVTSMNNDEFDNFYKLIEGNFPKNNNEIIINEHMLTEYKLGDIITSDVYDMKTDEYITTKEYKVVGVSEENFNFWDSFITTNEEGLVNAYITLSNPFDFKNSFVEILDADNYKQVAEYNTNKYEYYINNELLRWEVFNFSASTTITIILVLIIVILIIMVASIYCIKNSFEISITEKLKLYGTLSSIGATKEQIKKFVLKEGFFLGLIAIPSGLLLGTITSALLIFAYDKLASNGYDMLKIYFDFSFVAILLSLIFGALIIYLSCLKSTKIASKYSAIEGIRGNANIKINKKSLKVPTIISKLFNVGGVLAYKNLKRSKSKYKTTVVSLAVSILVFISMTTFVKLALNEVKVNYGYKDYNIQVASYKIEEYDEIYSSIKKFNDIDQITTNYLALVSLVMNDSSKIVKTDFEYYNINSNDILAAQILVLDDESFKDYVSTSKLKYDEVKDKAILYDYSLYVEDDKEYKERIYSYKEGDIIDSELTDSTSFKVTIGGLSEKAPSGFEDVYSDGGMIILNKDYYDNLKLRGFDILIDTDKPYELQEYINSLNLSCEVLNLDEIMKSERNIVIIVSVCLYGFIAVVSLIGLTNIFNTITSNIELRRREFATLKSIGMTKKEFNRMMNLETILYCSKSLVYGIVIGTIISFLIYKSFTYSSNLKFELPIQPIIICTIVVLIIVYIIMRYSMNNVNKRNIIETIRNENI